MSLNFANIIALPLLLGVGVSFNIYFVMNWRSGVHRFLGSATARAVMFSALTTSTAFGSLALSQHPGTASMGVLLLMSLGCTVLTTLAFTPALLGDGAPPRTWRWAAITRKRPDPSRKPGCFFLKKEVKTFAELACALHWLSSWISRVFWFFLCKKELLRLPCFSPLPR